MKHILIIFLCVVATVLNGQDLKEICRARVEADETPGISVAWYEDGKVNYYQYGVADRTTKEGVTAKTLFEIGSITKTFTCSILSLMALEKEMSLDEPAQKYLPESIKMPEKNGKQITLLNLATAHSGLPRMPNNFSPADPKNPYIDYTEKQLGEFLSKYELTREPGAQYEYSNLGMGTLGFLLARQKKTTYSKLLSKNIFTPLGMKDSYISGEKNPPLLATGYADQTPAPAWTWNDQSALTGAGGIISNAEDMMKYMIAQVETNKATLNKAFHEAHKERTDAGDKNQIALGWHIRDHKFVWHNGGTAGFRSFAGFDPEKKRAIVVLTNSSSGADDIGFHWLNPDYALKSITSSITLSDESLREYVGVYELSLFSKLTITKEGSALLAQITGQPKFIIYAEAVDKFFLKVVPAKMTFERGDDKKIVRLILLQNGVVAPARKIE